MDGSVGEKELWPGNLGNVGTGRGCVLGRLGAASYVIHIRTLLITRVSP